MADCDPQTCHHECLGLGYCYLRSLVGVHVEATVTGGMVVIWSDEHRAWWRAERCGYTRDIDLAGRYTFSEAAHATHHCGPDKRIRIDAAPSENKVIVTRVTSEGEIMVTLPSGRVMFMGFLVGARFVIDATRNGFKVTVED